MKEKPKFLVCMEDLISTTRYITWSLHNKNRGGLRQFLDSFGGTEQSNTGGNPLFAGLSPDSSLGSVAYEKQDSKPRADFNCFPLMPVVDKLPALLREDLESAFEDDLDNIFDITN
uniref:Uncharacterized protein n=1 Tax=Quercus lobata TaxID=97700 RepID=A0A7N2MWU4_QUELO